MNARSRKAERSEATQAALISTAEALFTERGFAATATEDIVARTGVTRGALYHHFKDKKDLFRAVFIAVEERLVAHTATLAAGADDPGQALVSGAHAFLDACMDPTVQRIVLLDAPSVLGWEEWRELDEHYGLGLVKAAVQEAIDAGVLAEQPVEPLAHLLLGALNEAALLIARANDVKATREEVGRSVELLLTSLAQR
jgi:AcrR family transcriptional regulator